MRDNEGIPEGVNENTVKYSTVDCTLNSTARGRKIFS